MKILLEKGQALLSPQNVQHHRGIAYRAQLLVQVFDRSDLGAGNIGGTLGRAWSAASHQVAFGVRDPQSQKAQAVLQNAGSNVTLGSIPDVLKSDPAIVVMAVPGASMTVQASSPTLVMGAGIAAAGGNACTHHKTPANCRSRVPIYRARHVQ